MNKHVWLSLVLCTSLLTAPTVYADSTSWKHHFSYESAQKTKLSRLWNPMDQGKPSDPMKTHEFVSLLHQVTGKPMNKLLLPNRSISRKEAAKWITDLTKFNTGIAYRPEAPFKDTSNPKDKEYQNAFAYVYYTGIMTGASDGRFHPEKPLTRGEATVILQRVLERMPQMAKDKAFEAVKEPLPETVYTLVKENREAEGLFTVSEGDYMYLVVNAGIKPTGGYTIKVNRISETNHAIYVQVEQTRPGEKDMVTMAISYPYQVVKIPHTTKRIFLLP